MKKIAVINQKGGVGKTTSVVNVGAGLARMGKRILAIDLDPQSHLSLSLGMQQQDSKRSMYAVMKGEVALKDVLSRAAGMDIAPSTLDMVGLEVELAMHPGREHIIRDTLRDMGAYDYIFMDCPPTLGLLSVNALVAADEVFIPLQAEFLALQGMSRLIKAIRKVKERLNSGLIIGGVFATRFDKRRGLNNEVLSMLYEHFGRRLFDTVIRDNIALAEAPSYGMSIYDYRADSHGASDYMALCNEILNRYDITDAR